jgi:hypothetical protein
VKKSFLFFAVPTNISFLYCCPSLSEFKNTKAVGTTGLSHTNSGLLYLPLPLKSTIHVLTNFLVFLVFELVPVSFRIRDNQYLVEYLHFFHICQLLNLKVILNIKVCS